MNRPIMWRENPISEGIRLHAQYEAEYADELALAANDDEDGDDKDANEESEFVRSIRPVSLEPDRNAEYEGFFYPSTREFLVPVLESLSDVTSNVNLFFRFMRQCMREANRISGMEEEQAREYVEGIFYNAMTLKRDEASVKEAVAGFLRAVRMESSAFHNIYRSARYSEGIDIVLNGTGTDERPENVPAPYFGSNDVNAGPGEMLSNHDSEHYFVQSHRSGRWQSPFGQNILAAAKEITIFLFGSSAISDRPLHRGLSINTRFSSIEQIWTKHTGVKLPSALVTDMEVTNHLAEQFLQIEVMKLPSEQAVKVAESIRKGAGTSESSSKNSLVETRLNENSTLVAPEAELLNLVMRTSIRFTLESDIAHYVSQTEANERPSLSRANAWFSVYIGQVIRAKVENRRKGVPSYNNAAAIKMVNIPRYSMGASTLKKISDIRAQHGFVVEKTKGNPEGLFIRPNGTLAARPDIEAFKASTLAEDHEKVSEEILEILSRNDIPLAAFNENPRTNAWPHVDIHDIERLSALMEELKGFEGCVIGYDWDFGITMTAGSTPGAATTRVDVGSVTPDSLTIADYLGYDLAKEGEKPMVRNFASAMYVMTTFRPIDEIEEKSEKNFGARSNSATFAHSDIVNDIMNLYMKLAYVDNKVPKLAEIAKTAMRVLGYEKLPAVKGHDYSTTYLEYFDPDGSLKSSQVSMTRRIPIMLLADAMTQAGGDQGSHLWNETFDNLRTSDSSPKSFEVQEELAEHPNYFNSSTSTVADFARLYSYFGGQVFKQILDAINSIPVADYFNSRGGKAQAVVGKNPYNMEVDYKIDVPLMNNRRVMQDILPFATMLGKYAPNKETIFAEADEQVESIRPDESFTSEDIKVPGMVTDSPRAVFPHQASVQSYLRKKVPPSFAILALDPGGGKTGQGVIDMTCMVKDMQEVGTVVRPLVICPNGLINQWCEDMKYFVGENWNAFPLSSAVMKRWGEKRLMEVAAAAPPNTIFIASMTFIQGRNKRVCIGNTQVNFSANLEFIRRLGCNYIAIDESHNLKSFSSARHRAVKILTTSTMVKWLRLLTGTIMPDRAKDIEGQIALKTPHVFRAGEIANIRSDAESDSSVKIGSRTVTTYTPLNGKRAVGKLSHYTAFIVKKRKEWAFMLPAPIETFHAIAMVDHKGVDGTSSEEIEQQKLHEQLYKLVLDETLEELKPLLAQKKKAEKAADSEYDGSGEDDGGADDDGDSGGSSRTDTTDNDSDFAGEKIKQALWEKNLARFERLIIAPQYDEAYEKVFGKDAVFKSRKAKYIANLVHLHFNTPAWRRGQQYTEYDLVSVGKDLYVAKKYHSSAEHMQLPRDQLSLSPDENPDYWKKEPRGKLIIITRYNHSASAIYDALPENYKSKAVKFTGDEPDKVKSFNDFKTDDRIQILIANEQGMSEGHNLQMASRIIRAESPWGPGALNQTNARIFRPDPKGAIAAAKGEGEMVRDVIYLDWVLANNTMEVPKQARVISKTFGIARFTEADNPRYTDLLTRRKVPTEREDDMLSLGIDMLKNTLGLEDEPFVSMSDAYTELNEIENKEFRDMRAEQEAKLLPIEAVENVAGAMTMDVRPFVPNMPVADPNKWKLTNVEVLMRDPEVAHNFKEELLKKPVLTEWGTGRIVGFNSRNGGTRLSSLIVNLKNPPPGMSSRVTIQPSMAYIAMENITPEQESKYFDVSTAGTDTEEKRQEARDKRLEKQQKAQEEQEEKERRIRERQQKETIGVIKKEQADAEKRQENEAKGKPVNDGIYRVKDAVIRAVPAGKKAVVTGDDPGIARVVPIDADLDVWLTPAYYHGFATLEAEFNEGSVNLKPLGFQHTPPYAFVTVSNKKKFHAIYEYLDANFDLPDKTVDLIMHINTAFEPGLKNTHKLWYSMELAPVSELPAFFAVGKRITANRRAVRVFPIFMEEHVMLCVDIRTNPAILKHIGKSIPGAAVKWQRSEGQWLYFGKNKTDLKAMIASVGKAGYVVANKAAALKELAELTFKYKKTKK